MQRTDEGIKGNYLKDCECGCGTKIWHKDKKWRIRKYAFRHKNGGICTTKKGYIKELRKEHRRADRIGYVYQHILVYEDTLNCCLLDGIDIHHKDKNQKNNNFSNLEPITHKNHTRHHTLNYQISRSNSIKDLSPRHIERSWLLWSWLLGLKRLKNQYDKRLR